MVQLFLPSDKASHLRQPGGQEDLNKLLIEISGGPSALSSRYVSIIELFLRSVGINTSNVRKKALRLAKGIGAKRDNEETVHLICQYSVGLKHSSHDGSLERAAAYSSPTTVQMLFKFWELLI